MSLSFHVPVWVSISVSPCHFSCPSGAIQSFAGFTDYFTAMAQEGWFPLLCVGLRPYWENHHLQDLQDSYGQEWVSPSPSSPSHGSLISSCPLVTELSRGIPGTQTLCGFLGPLPPLS